MIKRENAMDKIKVMRAEEEWQRQVRIPSELRV